MKKSRLYLTAGGLILAISAVFATKASKKFTPSIKTLNCTALPTNSYLSWGGTDLFTTASNVTGYVPASIVIYTGTNGTGAKINGQLKSEGGNPVFIDHGGL